MTLSQLPPLTETRGHLNEAYNALERAETERELLMELLRAVHLGWMTLGDDDWAVYAAANKQMAALDRQIVAILRGTPVAEVLRPDEDPEMEW